MWNLKITPEPRLILLNTLLTAIGYFVFTHGFGLLLKLIKPDLDVDSAKYLKAMLIILLGVSIIRSSFS